MAAALSLARRGFPAHVIEQAEDFGEIGAGLQLAPNATRVLDRLGLIEQIHAEAVELRRGLMMHAETGRHLATLDFGAAFRERYGQPYIVMHRGDLLAVLVDACRASELVTMESDTTAVGVDDRSDSVRVSTADGRVYHCGAVIGADGLWSAVRGHIHDSRPVCARYVAYRGAVPLDDIGISVRESDEVVWIGPGKHLVQYPIRRGELFNQVAVFRSTRYRPEIEATADWGTKEELDEAFSSGCTQVRASIALLGTDRRWPMYDQEPLPTWTRGRTTLLGDAAHPMLQYLAQGACQAIEDADRLARELARHNGEVVPAFHAYQEQRMARTALVQRRARWWGDLWHAEGDLVPALRDRILTTRAADDYSDLDWLYAPTDT